MPANELRDADVSYISLVKRGANRIPFRITKGEDMLDLSNLFRAKKSEVNPEVLGYVVAKGADYAIEALKSAGVDVQKSEISETSIVISKSDADLTGAVLVGLNEDVAVAVSRVTKDYDSYPCVTSPCAPCFPVYDYSDGTTPASFEKRVYSEGFLPSLEMASNILKGVIYSAVCCKNPQVDMVATVRQATSEFQAYVLMFIKNMPEEVLKAERELAKACGPKTMKEKGAKVSETEGEDGEKPEDETAVENQQDDPTVPDEKPKTPVKEVPEEGVPVKGAKPKEMTPGKNPDEAAMEEEKKACKKAEEDSIVRLVASFKEEVSSMIEGFDRKISDAAIQVAKLEQFAVEAESKASSTVIGNADVTDVRQVEKREEVRHEPIFDTAYQRL